MSDDLVCQAMSGDQAALAALFAQYRERLKRMILLRMDPRLQQRLDTSDVLQEAYIDLARRLPEYVWDPKLPFLLWLRMKTVQRLALAYPELLGASKRDVRREVTSAPTLSRQSVPSILLLGWSIIFLHPAHSTTPLV